MVERVFRTPKRFDVLVRQSRNIGGIHQACLDTFPVSRRLVTGMSHNLAIIRTDRQGLHPCATAAANYLPDN